MVGITLVNILVLQGVLGPETGTSQPTVTIQRPLGAEWANSLSQSHRFGQDEFLLQYLYRGFGEKVP